MLAGWHRLEAAKSLGWTTVKAEVFEGDELECELVEIDENLTNHDLTVLEQGVQLKRRNEILEAMDKRAKRGDNRFTADRGDTVTPLKTTEDIAKEAGLSKRSTQRRTQIARDLSTEASIIEEGVRNPLVLLGETLIDGHNRYEIAQKHILEYKTVVNTTLAIREEVITWIIRNQLGRRNLTAKEASYYRGKLYESMKKSHGGDRGNQHTEPKRQNDALAKTAEKIGK